MERETYGNLHHTVAVKKEQPTGTFSYDSELKLICNSLESEQEGNGREVSEGGEL